MNNSAEILLTFGLLCASYAMIFVLCEFGQRVNAVFEEMCIVFDQMRWYLFPIGIQKLLPTVLVVAQEPIGLNMFGSIACNRRTFKEVSIFGNLNIILNAFFAYPDSIFFVDVQ